jgi:hypothetical protein
VVALIALEDTQYYFRFRCGISFFISRVYRIYTYELYVPIKGVSLELLLQYHPNYCLLRIKFLHSCKLQNQSQACFVRTSSQLVRQFLLRLSVLTIMLCPIYVPLQLPFVITDLFLELYDSVSFIFLD